MEKLIDLDQHEDDDLRPKKKTALIIDLEGFEGPLDILLELARDQKVDLIHISILHLADQYLLWVSEARRKNLELAADYLVMAAWLAYLKSRLLIPEQADEEEPSAEEMAAALAFQLQRLEAMRNAGEQLMDRSILGSKVFKRGEPESFGKVDEVSYDITLYDLMKAYGDQMNKHTDQTLHIEPMDLYSMDMAIDRLKTFLGKIPEWTQLMKFLPDDLKNTLHTRSAVASTFAAALEMARDGKVKIRQSETFGAIYVQSPDPELEK
ncbi:ScpA family protein [Terasakiella sp. A23]|uniref:segregation and condensation protein A n=1 Tax=Terasakiella sp. FCG-A23 TaxID=3080561 RepID=UPI0029543CAC|nr:ScpA family protein [Terasakiella sp. A23]MDV7338764.1 ScpA family protein [Terasakiella sp. A23]